MLETVYNNLGFTGSLLAAFMLFLFIIFWIAGLAGIMQKEGRPSVKRIRMLFAILLPVYPFFWMIWEMIIQKIDIGR